MSLLEKRKQLIEEKEIEIQPKEQRTSTPQMSIGEQLNVLQEVKRIDYQNSLVMASLEKYNEKFEQLKKEQTELLENIKSQSQSLKKSNDLLSQNMKETLTEFTDQQKAEISGVIDKANEVIKTTENSLNIGLNRGMQSIKEESEKFIIDCEEKKKQTERRYNSFFERWKWLDYLIIADLLIMPIIIGFIAYKVFIVWG